MRWLKAEYFNTTFALFLLFLVGLVLLRSLDAPRSQCLLHDLYKRAESVFVVSEQSCLFSLLPLISLSCPARGENEISEPLLCLLESFPFQLLQVVVFVLLFLKLLKKVRRLLRSIAVFLLLFNCCRFDHFFNTLSNWLPYVLYFQGFAPVSRSTSLSIKSRLFRYSFWYRWILWCHSWRLFNLNRRSLLNNSVDLSIFHLPLFFISFLRYISWGQLRYPGGWHIWIIITVLLLGCHICWGCGRGLRQPIGNVVIAFNLFLKET